MGYYFQHIISQSEQRMEQLKVTQSIVDQIFDDTLIERTVAMRSILDELLESDELSKKLGHLIDKYLENLALTGTPDQLYSVSQAVEKFGSNAESLANIFNNSNDIQTKLNKYDLAILKEREAFNYLINNDLEKASAAFKKVDEIYPEFHSAYDISRYLDKNTASFNSDIGIKKIKGGILKNYSWQAPPDLLKKIDYQTDLQVNNRDFNRNRPNTNLINQ